MRTTYVSGAAWCIVHGDVLVVLDRGLDARAATAMFEGLDPAALRDEPLALAVLEPVDDGWLLWRRRGVPAVTHAALPERAGEAWGSDLLPTGATVAFGAVGALDDAMPLVDGVVRASAVRVELGAAVAPAPPTAPIEQPAPDGGEERLDAAPDSTPAPEPIAPPVAAPPEPATSSAAVPADPEPEPIVEHAPAEPADSSASEPVDPEPEPEPIVEHAPAEPADSSASEPANPEPAPEPIEHAPAATAAAPTDAAAAEPAETSDPMVEHAPTATIEPPLDEPRDDAARDASPGIGGIIDSVPGFIRPAAVVEVPDDLAMGDHDGMTVAGDEARRLAAAARAQQAAAPVLGPATGPVVLSTMCVAGHVNPPGATACACGAAIASDSADQRARPEFAELVLPDGERVPLGRGVVLGRRPRSRRVEDGRVPRLVTVHSPSEDISRSHLEVRCEDWNVLAIDLESTNGTVLLRDGAAPMRLRPDVPQLVAFGDRLDLGDGVVVRIERARVEGGS